MRLVLQKSRDMIEWVFGGIGSVEEAVNEVRRHTSEDVTRWYECRLERRCPTEAPFPLGWNIEQYPICFVPSFEDTGRMIIELRKGRGEGT